MLDITSNFKIQSYLNNQNVDGDDLSFIDNTKFHDMYTPEEYGDIKYKVNKYRELDNVNRQNPSYAISKEMSELNQDILYATGKDITKIQLAELNTTDRLDSVMMSTNLRSKNDLFVEIDYDDYSESSNYVKVKIVGHNHEYAYGIAANSRMVVTPNGTIVTTKNALYRK